MERIHSHLLWFGVLGHCLGHVSLWMHSWKTRELVCEVSERVSGNRLNRDLFMPGGVRRDLDEEALPWIAERLDRIKPALDAIGSVFFDDAVVRARTRGVGILSEETVRHYGAVGPLARASGVAVDVRKDDPYFAYPWVDWDLAIEKEGDVQAKARVRFSELGASIRIVEQCLDRLRPGPVAAHVRSLPPGMGIGRVEAPRGELFHCLVCDGTESPIRYHIRAPSYANLRTNEAACRGEELDDAVLVVAASDPCMACTERLVSVDAADPSHSARTGEELVRMSQAKTARLRKVPHQAAMKGIKGTG
jgi:NADH-quinone oxidoreductase subunit D